MVLVAWAWGQEVIERVTPIYPEAAQIDRITGTVVLDLDVEPDGSVKAARIVSGLREDVDQAALDAALKLRFAPIDAPTTIQYAFTFALKVEDQQGNPVPATIVLKLSDEQGLDLPGVKVVATNGEERRELVANDNGVCRAAFLEPGRWSFSFEKPGFSGASATIDVLPGETRTIGVELSLQTAEETVVVIGTRQRWHDVARAPAQPNLEPVTSQYTLTRRDVESTPGALEDVTRAVHKLPGVVSDGDMLGTFSVRGGSSSEVVFVLDRVPLDNPFHLAGFNSIFNPDLISQVQFYASAPPATMPDTTSAVMDVVSWDGERKTDRNDLDGAVDVSMSTARASIQGPLGEDFAFAFSGRRSYLEAYFAIMQELELLDTAIAAPEYDEIGLRGSFRKDEHKLRLTLLRTSDHLKLLDSEDDSLISIDGSFEMDSVVYLAAVDHTWTGEVATIESTLGFTFDQSHLARDFGGEVSQDVERQQYLARSDGIFALGAGHSLDVGFLGQVRRYETDGPVEDLRTTPTWAATPLTDFGNDLVEVGEPEIQPQAAIYAQHRWTGAARTRAGLRGTWVGRSGEFLLSPSVGVSLPLPTGTVPKLGGGIYHHVVEDPLTIDETYGNPELSAERATTVVLGLDQGLPIGTGGLVRIEGYYSRLEDLVVNGDTLPTDGAAAFQNVGSGHNLGVDIFAMANLDRFTLMASGSFLDATRNNPLNEIFPQTYTPGWTQAWSAGAAIEWQAAPKWRFTLRYDFHSGRPMSTVDVAGESTVKLAGLNDELTSDYHNVDFRLEWRHPGARIRWSYYFELLNVLYLQPDFLPIVTVEDGERTDSMLAHLPIRPFMGLRADF